MKILLKGIEQVFDCGQSNVCTVIIENPKMFYDIVVDIERQIEGFDGNSVLSEDNKPIRMDKNIEQITQFVPFDINKKTLLNKITSEMQKLALDDNHFLQTNELLTAWENLCINLEFEMPVNLDFCKINVESLIKASGIMIADDYISLAEKVIDYIQMVEKFEGKKLFVLVNMRSYIGNEEAQLFINEIVSREYQIIMLENKEYKLLDKEKRYLIDEDMCEICYNN